ncbi:hypothetical protein [Burkholderia cenocepacia]|uniref:hypothetical protein n=1 Tax=Burkholderia cenocepacia TaxID=95486 RepID=UPI002B24F23C|nr:hypothetical protein [Burkholderia cenocepacia]MEB2554037.1 hypothetical protein [Burkholderia cenocepacia]
MDDELIEQRFKLVGDRIDHYGERLDKLEGEDKHAEGMRLNWVVVGLFAIELMIGAWQLWWGMHHA